MFRTILLATKPAPGQQPVINFAESLAEKHQLILDACAVIDLERLAPAQSVPIGGGAYKAERDELRIAEARQNAAELLSQIDTESRKRGVACTTQVREGKTATILADAVQACDLLVCGHTAGGDASEKSLLQQILKHSSRPAIVVPPTGFIGRDVVVAYDGSPQAARALASFVGSGWAQGRTVHVVSFESGTRDERSPAEAARTYLHRHGITCVVRIEPLIKSPAPQILEEVTRVSAGWIVMGAFGSGAVREFLFGSVTRSILEVLPVPVFLDH